MPTSTLPRLRPETPMPALPGYSYVDANNKLQTVNYVADGLGFRVANSRLPVAPVYDGVAPTFNPEPLVAPVFDGVAPEPVVDTPEVAEAKAAHLAAVEAAKAERKRRSADPAVLAASTRVLTAPTPSSTTPPSLPPTTDTTTPSTTDTPDMPVSPSTADTTCKTDSDAMLLTKPFPV